MKRLHLVGSNTLNQRASTKQNEARIELDELMMSATFQIQRFHVVDASVVSYLSAQSL